MGRGARDGAAVALVSGLDLSTGETGTSIGAEGGLAQGNARIQARDDPPETTPVLAWFFPLGGEAEVGSVVGECYYAQNVSEG